MQENVPHWQMEVLVHVIYLHFNDCVEPQDFVDSVVACVGQFF